MKMLFYMLAIIGSVYFIFKKRKFDLYTFSFFSAIIYFIPGFLGYVVYPGKLIITLDVKTYAVFNLVIGSIFITALYKDIKIIKLKNKLDKRVKIREGRYTLNILIIISILAMIYEIVTVNKYLLSSKAIMMSKLGPMSILLRYSSSLAFIISCSENKRSKIIISFLPLLFMFLIGSRGTIALSILAVLILKFKESKATSLSSYKLRYPFFILSFGYIMIMGKIFYGTFKTQGLIIAISRLFNKEFVNIAFASMEPFGIQSILNEIIVTRMSIGFNHLKDIIYQLLIVPSAFGGDTQAFNRIIQTELFPGLNYGMAYNIWGEAIASGGFGFLLIIIILYMLILFILDKFMESNSNLIKGTSALIAANWGFFIHRNSIATQLTFTRHILYVMFGAFVCSTILMIVLNPQKKTRTY